MARFPRNKGAWNTRWRAYRAGFSDVLRTFQVQIGSNDLPSVMAVRKNVLVVDRESVEEGYCGFEFEVSKRSSMTKFEDMGRKLDRELERLREITKKKISPATRGKTAKVLRGVSAKLSRLAEELESKSTSEE